MAASPGRFAAGLRPPDLAVYVTVGWLACGYWAGDDAFVGPGRPCRGAGAAAGVAVRGRRYGRCYRRRGNGEVSSGSGGAARRGGAGPVRSCSCRRRGVAPAGRDRVGGVAVWGGPAPSGAG